MSFAREAGCRFSLAPMTTRADLQNRLVGFLILRDEGLAFESAYAPVVLAP